MIPSDILLPLSVLAALIPSVTLVCIAYALFFQTLTARQKLARTLGTALLSPVVFIALIRLADAGVAHLAIAVQQPESLLMLRISVTTFLALVLFVGGLLSFQRLIGTSRGFARILYGACMVIAVVSLNMRGVTSPITAVVLTAIFCLLMKDELPFLAKNDRAINYRPFFIAEVISYLLVIGSMTEVLTISESVMTAQDAQTTYAWACVIAFIFACAQLLLKKTISQGIRGSFEAQQNLAHVTKLNQEILDTQDKLIQSFSEILEGKSGQSGNHVKRVSEYSALLAEAMGLDEKTVHRIEIAAMMHDCGKLMIPNEILEKPARLTQEEYEAMKQHVYFGELMLKNVPGEIMQEAFLIATQHHERWDGHGYLRHLSGENIAVSSRIVAVADVFDALTSRRSYKEAWTEQDAYEEIVKNRGTQFAPQVIDAFIQCFPKLVQAMDAYRD